MPPVTRRTTQRSNGGNVTPTKLHQTVCLLLGYVLDYFRDAGYTHVYVLTYQRYRASAYNVTSSSGGRRPGQPKRQAVKRQRSASPTPQPKSPHHDHGKSNDGKHDGSPLLPTKVSQYWLMKAEPESRVVKGIDVKFSIDDLAAMPKQTSPWDGVRNYEARNIMRDRMKLGDLAFFYHSNCRTPGIAGIVEIVREGYPDYTACDPNHPYYDAKVKSKDPAKWFMVDVRLVEKFSAIISLKELQQHKTGALGGMVLLNRGRLSVQSVSPNEFAFIKELASSCSMD
ncbi:hypothetical protein H4R34_001508 [Dimargaris verticillata]|uniref:Thymocyte nuclear protein 1 n=1 Tax=Dimargaris verticillata TaxID=2761393 RepID=A0A9W8B3H1_9FUNG|nr:hypothetical protein H4R34_001508 [Dimargaris verticillata]